MPAKLKLDDDGHVVVQDGKPVFILDDGKEVAYDADYSNSTITRLTAEAKKAREEKEAAETSLKAFEGIEDPAKAIDALKTVAAMDSGALVAAGRVKEIQDAAQKAAEDQVAAAIKASNQREKDITGERDSAVNELHSEKIGGSFSRSKYIADKCSIPHDMVQARFGPQFKFEDKRVIGYDVTGNKIYSRSKPGELADFDEAIEVMIDAYPYKDQVLKGTGSSGAGSEHGAAGSRTQVPKGNMGGSHKERVEALLSKHPELGNK